MNGFLRWMHSKRKLSSIGSLLSLLSVMSGCASAGQAKYRVFAEFVNAAPVIVVWDGKTVGSIPYQGFVGPSPTGAGSHTVLITDTGNSEANLASLTSTLASGTQSSFFFCGPQLMGNFILHAVDDTTPAANSQAKLRIINASLQYPNLDAYVVLMGTSPSGNPTVSGATEPYVSSYQTLAPDIYDIDFTLTGTKQVLYTAGPLTLAAGQNRTVVLLTGCTSSGVCGGGSYASVTIADLN